MTLRTVAGIVVALIVGLVGAVKVSGIADDDAYAPDHIQKTASALSTICLVAPICPVSRETLGAIKRAAVGNAAAEDLLGLTLLTGDGLSQDRNTGMAWVARAAEDGDPDAARDVAGRLRNGETVKVDETKIAASLQRRVDAGDPEAMRALGPMIIRGRGAKQDLAGGLAMLKRAASLGSSGAEEDLARLYMNGAPGVTADRGESLKWFESSARHGDPNSMLTLGYLALNASNAQGGKDVTRGFCWLMRAALLNGFQAQEKLSMVFASGETDERGASIAADLVQADLWLRLAARSPFHDNPQIRASIEPNMTTEQIDAAKSLVEAWRPRRLDEVKRLDIAMPFHGGASPHMCPPMS